MDKALKQIKEAKYKGINKEKKRKEIENKKKYYKVGKALTNGYKLKLHKEQKMAARRAYQYYREDKGNWEGPMPWTFGKILQPEFDEVFKGRKHRGETLLESTSCGTESRDGITGLISDNSLSWSLEDLMQWTSD